MIPEYIPPVCLSGQFSQQTLNPTDIDTIIQNCSRQISTVQALRSSLGQGPLQVNSSHTSSNML